MVQPIGFDSSSALPGSTVDKRPVDRQQNSTRISPTTKLEVASPDSRRRLDSPETAPKPTGLAFTAKFGPDKDGFPLQLISGDQIAGAVSYDIQIIAENRVSQDSQTTLLQAQENSGANEARRQAATEPRAESNFAVSDPSDTQTPEPDETGDSRTAPGSTVDLRV